MLALTKSYLPFLHAYLIDTVRIADNRYSFWLLEVLLI